MAGVSVATVSRVFNRPETVSADTRARVLAAAEAMGFRPNMAARTLRTGRVEAVALVLRATHLSGEFYAEFLGGCHTELQSGRIHVLLSVVPADENPEAWVRDMVLSGMCNAVAIHFELIENPAAFQALPVPVTVFNYFPEKKNPLKAFASVGFDNRIGAVESVRHVARLGHRRIACITGTRGNQDSEERLAGFHAGMREMGLPVEDKWIVPGNFEDGPGAGVAGLNRLLAGRGKAPTAVLCGSDNIALGVLQEARKWGLSVPEDLSVAGFDDFLWAASYSPPLTTVSHRGWELGTALGRLLLDMDGGGAAVPPPVVLPTRLVVRESTAAPSRSR